MTLFPPRYVYTTQLILNSSCIMITFGNVPFWFILILQFEKERGHAPSSIDCYTKQYGVSEQEAIDVFNKQIVESWKDINEEFLKPTAVPMPVLMRVLNLTRVADLLYKGEDGFTRVGKMTKDSVAAVIIDSVPL